MIGEVIALGASYFGATALFGIFMWRAFAKLFESMRQSMNDKFDHMNDKFDHMNDKFDHIEGRLDALGEGLDALAQEHHALARELSEFRGEMRGRVVG